MANNTSPVIGSESAVSKRASLARVMSSFREVRLASFDIFDTLLLRPFADPKDLFYILGGIFHDIDFYNLRIRCEKEARDIRESKYGNREINIYDIYERINYYTGIDIEYGVRTEFETEMELLYPNDYEKYIFETFRNNGVPIVIVSDMYYPADMMEQLLEKNGITGYEKLYVSCDMKCSKSDGTIFDCVFRDHPETDRKQIMHIDDNWPVIVKARELGMSATHYVQSNNVSGKYRPPNMSEMVGSAYKGVVNNYLSHNEISYSVPYEYGFIYGGILIMGYCSYIHQVCVDEKIEKVFFMSRDGDIIKQVWDQLYNDVKSEYLLTSRESTMRLSVSSWRKLFIEVAVDRMSTRKNPMTVEQIIDFLEVPELMDKVSGYRLENDTLICRDDAESVSRFRDLIVDNIKIIEESYCESNGLYIDYLKEMLEGVSSKIALVDIGWRGTNGYAIAKQIELFAPEITTVNFLVGGRLPFNLPQIRNSEMRTWLFSSEQNYGVLKRHSNNTNFFFELMTMSASPTFRYFYKTPSGQKKIRFSYLTPQNFETTLEVQRGIMDFVKEYSFRFRAHREFLTIPPDDAAEVIYRIFEKPEYFKKYFSDMAFSSDINSDDRKKFGDWI